MSSLCSQLLPFTTLFRSRVEEEGVPAFLWRSQPDEKALAQLPVEERSSGETSAKQVFDRLAGTWAYWGWKGGYLDRKSTRLNFSHVANSYDVICLLHRVL